MSDIVSTTLMTFKMLRYIQLRRHPSQRVDVTTIAHALMMLGMNRFRAFQRPGDAAVEHSPQPGR